MNCGIFKTGDSYAHVCGGRAVRKAACCYCGKASQVLCDYPVGKTSGGKIITCDRALCVDCKQQGISSNVDFCREHYPLAKAAYERRNNNG